MRDQRAFQTAREVEEAVERMYRAVDNLPDTEGDAILHPAMDRVVKQYFDLYKVAYVTCDACGNHTAMMTARLDKRRDKWVGRCCELPLPKQPDKRFRKRHRKNR
jgi:hypothetical protein